MTLPTPPPAQWFNTRAPVPLMGPLTIMIDLPVCVPSSPINAKHPPRMLMPRLACSVSGHAFFLARSIAMPDVTMLVCVTPGTTPRLRSSAGSSAASMMRVPPEYVLVGWVSAVQPPYARSIDDASAGPTAANATGDAPLSAISDPTVSETLLASRLRLRKASLLSCVS